MERNRKGRNRSDDLLRIFGSGGVDADEFARPKLWITEPGTGSEGHRVGKHRPAAHPGETVKMAQNRVRGAILGPRIRLEVTQFGHPISQVFLA